MPRALVKGNGNAIVIVHETQEMLDRLAIQYCGDGYKIIKRDYTNFENITGMQWGASTLSESGELPRYIFKGKII